MLLFLRETSWHQLFYIVVWITSFLLKLTWRADIGFHFTWVYSNTHSCSYIIPAWQIILPFVLSHTCNTTGFPMMMIKRDISFYGSLLNETAHECCWLHYSGVVLWFFKKNTQGDPSGILNWHCKRACKDVPVQAGSICPFLSAISQFMSLYFEIHCTQDEWGNLEYSPQ